VPPPPAAPGRTLGTTARNHILYGDGRGRGGHLHGTGIPGKTEFPEGWDGDRITRLVQDVARNPDWPPKARKNGTWQCKGVRDKVEIVAYVGPDGAVTAGYPKPGPGGVEMNPEDGHGRG